MRIGFIRHGETAWNAAGRIQGQTDIPLNEQGRSQARLLGKRLAAEAYEWDFVMSSGLSRAEETGAILASMLHIPMKSPDSRLLERSYGKVEGLTSQEREQMFGSNWKLQDLGQESDAELLKRGKAFLEEMLCKYPDHSFLVVSHGGFLAQLFAGLDMSLQIDRIGNLSLTIMEHSDLKWTPLLLNCTQHLIEERQH
ncbi:histidine phosphatase family protein [Paenibacillus sp. F411]|uniref:Phosphoglycerate mutase n=1 Tax=Paenibacillus algicola TaxID=2565926 RepID=A0A4P8XM50_9BACL|nr:MULTISPECIES: histidine phosphatase family protein [Paenibacillus]MBO2943166.1 histidine phosphatase family protein [Paenibacillus sp. F411]QCT02581.1 Phosphoglycerate mutase [Paenibacillus algicola]